MKRIGFVLVAYLCLTSPVLAKDMTGRLALGFNSLFANTFGYSSTPALSLKYALSPAFQTQGILGFVSRETGSNSFTLGVRFLSNFVREDNMNLYGVLGAGFLRDGADPARGIPETTDAGRLQLGTGLEFFFFDFPNLGFSVEVGVDFFFTDQQTIVGVNSGSFELVGIHYYFN